MLAHSVEARAIQMRYMWAHPDFARQLRQTGREPVRRAFLTRWWKSGQSNLTVDDWRPYPTGSSAVPSVPPPFERTLSTPPSCRNLSHIPLIPTPERVLEGSDDIPFPRSLT